MFLIYLHSEQTRGWSCNVLSIAWRLWEFVANTGSNILELALHAWEDYPAVISAISFFPASDYPGVLGLDVKRWRTNLPPKSLMSLLALSPFYLWRPTARVTPPPPPPPLPASDRALINGGGGISAVNARLTDVIRSRGEADVLFDSWGSLLITFANKLAFPGRSSASRAKVPPRRSYLLANSLVGRVLLWAAPPPPLPPFSPPLLKMWK